MDTFPFQLSFLKYLECVCDKSNALIVPIGSLLDLAKCYHQVMTAGTSTGFT